MIGNSFDSKGRETSVKWLKYSVYSSNCFLNEIRAYNSFGSYWILYNNDWRSGKMDLVKKPKKFKIKFFLMEYKIL